MKHSVGKTITTTGSDVELFTVPNGYVAEITTLFISNTAGSTASVSVYWQHGHDATHKIYIINGKSLNSKDYLEFSNGSLVFKSGDSFQVQTNTSGISFIATFDLRKELPMYTFDDE
jgi:hypothetical protein